MIFVLYLIIFIFGTAVGSFLNVLADRLPTNQNPFRGRSRCDFCKHTLSPLDLIPLISFIRLKGKCRYCHNKLSWQYPLIEAATGLIFVFTLRYVFQLTANSLQLLATFNLNALGEYLTLVIVFCSFLVMTISDLKYQILPDEMVVVSGFSALIYQSLINRLDQQVLLIVLMAGVLSGLFFLTIYFVTKGKGMGFGDVKLAVSLGIFLSFPLIIVAFYTAFLTGATVAIILILAKKKSFGQQIAFGPFLILGSLVAFFIGKQIISWYLSLLL